MKIRKPSDARTLVLILFLVIPIAALAGVASTKHNLSVIATTETQVCKFCHTPHNASPGAPLWNHELSYETYTNYWSPTLKSYAAPEDAPPVDGFSKLCLGCHDGTIALGALINDEYIETTPDIMTDSLAGYLGTDLSGGHPISIVFDEALVQIRNAEAGILHLNWPITDKEVKLYATQGGMGVQCTSCHDPHGGRGQDGTPFWQKATYEEVCLVCHDDSVPIGH